MRSATGTTRSTLSALPRTGRRHSEDPRHTPTGTAMRRLSCGFTAATGHTKRWISGLLRVSTRRSKTWALPTDERLRRVLHDCFAWATTTTMSRYERSAEDVPDGLQIPQWS